MRPMLRSSTAALFASLLGLSLFASAQAAATKPTYRWTDEKGRVHYSDVPAPQSERVDVKRSGQVSKVPAEVAAAEARARECQRRRDQLAKFSTATEVTETDSLGVTRSFTEDERRKLIERTEQQVKDVCPEDQSAGVSAE